MSKAQGRLITVKFTEDLVGDISGNEQAFKVTGQEYKYVNGPLLDKEYEIASVERYPVQRVVSLRQMDYTLNDVVEGVNFYLDSVETGQAGYSENLATGKSYFAKGTLASNPMTNAFDGDLNTFWRDTGSVPSWLGVDLGEDVQVVKINMAGVATRIKDFILQGSTNNSTWVDIYTGQQTNDNVLRTYTFENNNAYRYYRVYISSVWSTGYGPGLSELELYSLGQPQYEYIESGTVIAHELLTGQFRVRWQEDKPIGTDITIEYATGETQGAWIEISNGEVITSDTNLWLRAMLETTDTENTPILQDLWAEGAEAPTDKILITMNDFGRFPTVEGNLTVEYDASVGSLAGSGGPVESFIETFTPTDLIPEPNPGIEESVTVAPASLEVDLLAIEYIDRFAEETDTITVAPAELTVELLHTSVVNP